MDQDITDSLRTAVTGKPDVTPLFTIFYPVDHTDWHAIDACAERLRARGLHARRSAEHRPDLPDPQFPLAGQLAWTLEVGRFVAPW